MLAEEAWVHRNEVARLNHWAVDRPHLQHAMRVCFSKFAALLTDDDWLRLNVGMYVKVLPTVGLAFASHTALSRLAVPRDSDWAGDRNTRQGMLSVNILDL